MKIQIFYVIQNDEVKTCKAFLEWQGQSVELFGPLLAANIVTVQTDPKIKHFIKVGPPKMVMNDEVIAIGMKKLWEYWEKNGLFYAI